MNTELFLDYHKRITENCARVIVGKEEAITKLTVCFLCGGHLLLEDVPGTGKTMLFRAFAKSVDCDFKRIQFTPDVLPSDITGINFYNMKTGEFELRKGPLFTNLVLADEINRATPRTQSSLLEAMAERQISIDGETYPLAEPFMVAATQNPLESYGTFPLPEAQLDRFMMRMSLGYMKREEELSVLRRKDASLVLEELTPVVTAEETRQIREALSEVEVSDAVAAYIMDMIERTRNDERFLAGASTRGAQALYRASQGYAALSGRSYVTPEDVKYLAPEVLVHRLTFSDVVKTGQALSVFEELLAEIPVPLEA